MKKQEYIDLYRTEKITDPISGKTKKVEHYVGDWYTYNMSLYANKRTLVSVCSLLSIVCFVTAGLITPVSISWGVVQICYIVTLLPLFFMTIFAVKFALFAGKKINEIQKRMLSALG